MQILSNWYSIVLYHKFSLIIILPSWLFEEGTAGVDDVMTAADDCDIIAAAAPPSTAGPPAPTPQTAPSPSGTVSSSRRAELTPPWNRKYCWF